MARDSIGLALSGGGFRASLWALGALLHLEDAGAAGRVTTVSSVSGGSISNGVAAFGGDYGGTNQSIRKSAERLISLAADDGLVLFGPATNRYVRTLLTFAGLAASSFVATILGLATSFVAQELIDRLPFASRLVYVVVGVSLIIGFALVDWAVAGKAARRDRVFRGIVVLAIVVGVLLAVAGVVGWGRVLSDRVGVTISVVSLAVSLMVTVVLVGKRSVKVEQALASELFSTKGKAALLADLEGRRVLHVFCATELQSGIHAYFSPKFVYSFRFGLGQPGPLPLARAVQASAALPGGFRARRIPTTYFRLDRVAPSGEPHAGQNDPMVLLDGGVYDNMGVSWFVGLDQRRDTWTGRPFNGLADPGYLLVVNASAGWEWRPMKPRAGLLSELAALVRVQDVMYKTTTRPRRHHLVREWQLLDKCDLPGARGAIVNIDQSPWELAASVEKSKKWGKAAEQALAALERLRVAGGPNRDEWRDIATLNAIEPTVLRALGREPSQRLVWHAYILTAVASHIFLTIPLPSRLPLRDELLDIAKKKPAPTFNEPTWYEKSPS